MCGPHFPELTGFSGLRRNQNCFWDSAIIIIRLVECQAAGRYCSQSSEQWGSLDQDPTDILVRWERDTVEAETSTAPVPMEKP